MAIGMSVEDYWEKPERYAQYFIEAQTLKNQQKNEELWLQGAYICDAVIVGIQACFGKKSNRPKYPQKPYDILPKLDEQKQKEAERERQKALESFTRMQAYLERKHGTKDNRT